jgi:hypothetical protein
MLKNMLLLLIIANLAAVPVKARGQSLADSGDSAGVVVDSATPQVELTYTRPTRAIQLRNYAFDAFGPYPIVGAALTAGIDQGYNSPPEWKQGAQGYGKRFASDFGTAAVSTSTRYALATAFKQDTMYYRCECTGIFPRLKHAVTSTVMARRNEDGRRVISVPSLVAPYAGTITAVYGWYPSRFGAQDAFRMGNYSLLVYMGENIALEFLYSGPHSVLSRMHLNNAHAAVDSEPKQ